MIPPKRFTFYPERCGERPCIRGMRMRVKDVSEMLAGGASTAEIPEDFPYLDAEDINACLALCRSGNGPLHFESSLTPVRFLVDAQLPIKLARTLASRLPPPFAEPPPLQEPALPKSANTRD